MTNTEDSVRSVRTKSSALLALSEKLEMALAMNLGKPGAHAFGELHKQPPVKTVYLVAWETKGRASGSRAAG